MYLGDFTNKEDVINEFHLNKDTLNGARILLAWYGLEQYDGSAFVLLERNGVLYEVNGDHCSCYGLEEQWDEEETTVAELKHRIKTGYLGRNTRYEDGVFDQKLLCVLRRWERNKRKLNP